MNLSQKCQYALRSLFELARRHGQGPVSVSEIAKSQAIPPRFLELILAELKHGGFVESRRGVQGGYVLSRDAHSLSVGEIIRFVEGPLAPVRCLGDEKPDCPLLGHCAFIGLWRRAMEAVEQVYDSTTVADLVEEERSQRGIPAYAI